jgi:TPR repeat protein
VTPSPFEQAVAYERGHGVARDFHKAGELFGKLCGEGLGAGRSRRSTAPR